LTIERRWVAAALPLIDEHGRRRTLASLRGMVLVLADVLTTF
jgi:hypothetical protein